MSGYKKTLYKNLNAQENIKKDSNRYFPEIVWKILNFISQIYGVNIWESGVLDRNDPGRNSSPMILIGNQIVCSWN